MPDRAAHILQAERNESFLRRITVPEQPFVEWIVTVQFYVCLHYLDAFLATKGHVQVTDHSDRFTRMLVYEETRTLYEDYERLYKESKEARYQCTPYTREDLRPVDALYVKVRERLRTILDIHR